MDTPSSLPVPTSLHLSHVYNLLNLLRPLFLMPGNHSTRISSLPCSDSNIPNQANIPLRCFHWDTPSHPAPPCLRFWLFVLKTPTHTHFFLTCYLSLSILTSGCNATWIPSYLPAGGLWEPTGPYDSPSRCPPHPLSLIWSGHPLLGHADPPHIRSFSFTETLCFLLMPNTLYQHAFLCRQALCPHNSINPHAHPPHSIGF